MTWFYGNPRRGPNPKFESRNPKQIRNTKLEIHFPFPCSFFRISTFEFVSDFDIRISDFDIRIS